jgi:hypothetical protein
MARAHLAKWVAAATVVQQSVRAWLLRRRLQGLLQQHRLAAVALQAAWRGRQVRQQQVQLEACCVRIQVCVLWSPLLDMPKCVWEWVMNMVVDSLHPP